MWAIATLRCAPTTRRIARSCAGSLLDEFRRELAVDVDVPRPSRLRPAPASARSISSAPVAACRDESRWRRRHRLSPSRSARRRRGDDLYLSAAAASAVTCAARRSSRVRPSTVAPTTPSRSSATCCGVLDATACHSPSAEDADGAPGYRLQGLGADLAWPATARGAPTTRSARPSTRRGRPGQRVLPRVLPARRPSDWPADGPRAHRPGGADGPRGAREAFRQGRCRCCTARRRWSSASTSPSLNAVGMRNVPPTPANYAQRSGPGRPVRAARPGHHLLLDRQRPRPVLLPAPRPDGRRAGRAAAPRPGQRGPGPRHVHAIWLAETGQDARHLG